MTPPTPATALTPEHLAAAREQAGSALAGCAWCQVPHKAPNDAMHRPVPYDLTVPASEMLELLDHIAALEARAIEPAPRRTP